MGPCEAGPWRLHGRLHFKSLRGFGPNMGLKVACGVVYKPLILSAVKVGIFISLLKTRVALDISTTGPASL